MKNISFTTDAKACPREPVAYRGANSGDLYFQEKRGQWFCLTDSGALCKCGEPGVSSPRLYTPIYEPVTITLS